VGRKVRIYLRAAAALEYLFERAMSGFEAQRESCPPESL